MKGKTVLVAIDVQNVMFFGEDGMVYNGDKVLDNILKLLSKARESKTPIIFIQHTDKEGELKRGMKTWQLNEKLSSRKEEAIVEKTSWDAFYNTKFEEELRRINADKIVFCGMQTEFCLDTTCRSAYSRGYHHNILVSDAHTTFDTNILEARKIIEHHNNTLGGRFVTLKKTEEIEF